MPMNNYIIHITYRDDIRSIDLENILSGIRLIGEHELSKLTGQHVRNFTDSFRIKNVEKGSIIVNLNIDINITVNLFLYLTTAITLYSSCKNMSKLLKAAVRGIKSALKRGISIQIKRDSNGIQDLNVNGDFDGTISLGKNGELQITNNRS